MPKISVIVPSYNQGQFLEECLRSILDQDYEDIEVLVMDGGSTDNSLEIIEKYEERLDFWQSRPDGGQAAAVNAGVAKATGDLVYWLNSDDVLCPNALRTVARAFRVHPSFGLYIGNGFRLDERTGKRTPFISRSLALHRRALREGLDYILQPATFFWREAWNRVGGLNEKLNFCMDWDILIRIAETHGAVLINEFLASSREYDATKTSSGRMARIAEICKMAQAHTGRELTPGAAVYLFEALNQGLLRDFPAEIQEAVRSLDWRSREALIALAGNRDGFPCESDPQDVTYMPFAGRRSDACAAAGSVVAHLPRISVVMPSFNQAAYIGRALQSLIDQNYPQLELIVIDGGSRDGTVEIIHRLEEHITYWESERDRGPAHAINKGFAKASGEILGWLNSDDMLTEGALWEIARTFVDAPEINMVFGNALYVDEIDRPILMDHGSYRTSLYFGAMQPRERVPAFWTYVHSVPQPTVYFRRDLLNRAGQLSEKYKFIFDFELFFRFLPFAKTQKIDRLLAFYRIHSEAKTAGWQNFLVELYEFSRSWWPHRRDPAFQAVAGAYARSFLDRLKIAPDRLIYRAVERGIVVGTEYRFFNPERLALYLQKRTKGSQGRLVTPPGLAKWEAGAAPVKCPVPRRDSGWSVAFCSYFLPKHPGHSGGEIRDFHLIRQLQQISRVSFFSVYDRPDDRREDDLLAGLGDLYEPTRVRAEFPQFVEISALRASFLRRAWAKVRRLGVVVPNLWIESDVSLHGRQFRAFSARALARHLERQRPDFLFVGPQTNPAALHLSRALGRTRTILATYDVEHIRVQRLAVNARGIRRLGAWLEARRARNFEARNLARFDGVIAVSELDRSIFVSEYGLPPERVLVIENGVDVDYFSYVPRLKDGLPAVVFVGSLGYAPNHFAALRLISSIMPLVWQEIPAAQAWIVGQSPREELVSHSDGKRVFVTGRVDDVRPFLGAGAVMCAPLESGSGTKYKILEAMSVGIPVVCTSLATEGLDFQEGKDFLIADSAEGLAKHIVSICQDQSRATALAWSARRSVEVKYSWNTVLRKLEPWLHSICALPQRASEE
jgi:glycosyltransferase involved in cell wall biosynthesis